MVEDQKHGLERICCKGASGGIASPSGRCLADAGWFAEPMADRIEAFGYADGVDPLAARGDARPPRIPQHS